MSVASRLTHYLRQVRWHDLSAARLAMNAWDVSRGSGYEVDVIKRRGGRARTVYKPSTSVDLTLSQIARYLKQYYSAPDAVHGFVQGRGILTNAMPHCGKEVVVRIDIRHFFEAVDRGRAYSSLQRAGVPQLLAFTISRIACGKEKFLLTGFRTSPIISNIAFAATDARLTNYAMLHGLTYTRYVDDLNFSGSKLPLKFIADVSRILSAEGWTVNQKKTRVMRRGRAQYVTGLNVSNPDSPRVSPKYRRRLRQKIHYLNKFGYEDCINHDPDTPGYWVLKGKIDHLWQFSPVAAAWLEEDLRTIDFALANLSTDEYWQLELAAIGVPPMFGVEKRYKDFMRELLTDTARIS